MLARVQGQWGWANMMSVATRSAGCRLAPSGQVAGGSPARPAAFWYFHMAPSPKQMSTSHIAATQLRSTRELFFSIEILQLQSERAALSGFPGSERDLQGEG